MANMTSNAGKKRTRKEVVREDLYNRYEIDGTNSIVGEFYVPKTLDTLTTSQTMTITVIPFA